MSTYPIENLLRPPVEWVAAITSAAASLVLFQWGSHWFMLPPIITKTFAVMLGLGALWRGCQGYRLIRYQRRIRTTVTYHLPSKQLPVNHQQLFLGQGFQWQIQHTQRFYAIQQQSNKRKVPQGKTNNGNPAIHGVELREQKIFLPLQDRVGHTLILGTTRVGKTRLLELMISADIRRSDSPVIVIDPKGDIELLKRMIYEAQQSQRQGSLRIFHLGYPQVSARYNPIGQFARITEVASRLTQSLPSQGEAAAFKEFAWRFVNTIANTLHQLNERPTYRLIHRYLLNIEPLLRRYSAYRAAQHASDWQVQVEERLDQTKKKKWPAHVKHCEPFLLALIDYLDQLNGDDTIYQELKTIWLYEPSYFQKITLSLAPLFAKLTHGDMDTLLSPRYQDQADPRPIINWMEVIQKKQIVYVGLDALSDGVVASSVGHAMFADLCSTLGKIYKFGITNNNNEPAPQKTMQPIAIYADEFNELASDEFIALANKGGGAGLQLTVATQTTSDLIARLGHSAKAQQLFGNFNNVISLRVLDTDTARFFIDKLPQQIPIGQLIPSSSIQDSEQRVTSAHNADQLKIREVPLLNPEMLMQLPKGHAFCLFQGSTLYKIQFPLLVDEVDQLSDSVEKIVTELHDYSKK